LLGYRKREILLAFNGGKLELEDAATVTQLLPGIDKMENSVVGPDSLFDFLINTDAFRLAMARLELLGCTVKFAVLGRESCRRELRLVYGFRVWVD